MNAPANICPELFQSSHVTMLAAIDSIDKGLAGLHAPYSESLLYILRRRFYKIEKTTKSLSLTLLPMLAFELEASLGDLANLESAKLDENKMVPLFKQGLQYINQGMQALARGEQEASIDATTEIGRLLNTLRKHRGVESIGFSLAPSEVTVPACKDELDNFERSLQAMQKELKEVVSNKPSEKPGWLNKVVDSFKPAK